MRPTPVPKFPLNLRAAALAASTALAFLAGCNLTEKPGPAPIILHLKLADSLRNYDRVTVEVSPAGDTSVVTDEIFDNTMDSATVLPTKTLTATDPFVVKVRAYRGAGQLAVQTLIYYENGQKRVVQSPVPPLTPYNILTRLSATPGTLDPPFSPEISRYTLTMPSGATQVTFSLRAAYPKATVTLNGVEYKPNDPDKVLPLANSTYTLPIMVTDLGVGRDYFVTIKPPKDIRIELDSLAWSTGALVPPFNSAQLDYTLTLPSTAAFVDLQFWATDPGTMQVMVLGTNIFPGVKHRVNLAAPGASTVVTVQVEKGDQNKDYTFTVKRAP